MGLFFWIQNYLTPYPFIVLLVVRFVISSGGRSVVVHLCDSAVFINFYDSWGPVLCIIIRDSRHAH